MKKSITILLFFALTVSCYSQNARMISGTDPNGDPNWIWYQEYPNGLDMYYEFEGSIIKLPCCKQTPFFTSGHPLKTTPAKKDMWPEDGWVLLYRDFGTATSAPKNPFFVLYNKYRGILRYMFYNAQETSYSYYRAELSFVDTELSAAFMTLSAEEQSFLNNYDNSASLNYLGKVAQFDGWGYADFQLFGYDPNSDPNSELRIEIYGINESALTLESTVFTLEQVFDKANMEGNKSSSSSLKDAFNDGQKIYKSSENALESLADRVEEEQALINSGDPEPWWFNVASSISNSSTLASAIPIIGGAVGFIKTLFFSDDATPKPLNFNGSLKLDGTIQSTALLTDDDFILNHTASPTSAYYIPLNEVEIGVFNLIDRPELTVDICDTCGPVTIYFYKLNTSLNYVFNDASDLQLTSMRASYVYDDSSPSLHENPIILEDHIFLVSNSALLPSGINLELKFLTKDEKNNSSEIIIYKNYPLTHIGSNELESSGVVNLDNNITLNSQTDFTDLNTGNTALAVNSITAGNQFYVGGSLEDVTLIAGDDITLSEGFYTEPSSSFRAVVPDFNNLENARLDGQNPQLNLSQDFYLKSYDKIPDFETLRVYQNKAENHTFDTEVGNSLAVYPNPAIDYFSFTYNLESNENLLVELISIEGKKIITKKIEGLNKGSHDIFIETDGIKKGVYLLKVHSNFKNMTGKIILKN